MFKKRCFQRNCLCIQLNSAIYLAQKIMRNKKKNEKNLARAEKEKKKEGDKYCW